MYADVLGVGVSTEIVKLAVTLLAGKALTWWRSVSMKSWAILGVCTWENFCAKIEEEFKDLHHTMK